MTGILVALLMPTAIPAQEKSDRLPEEVLVTAQKREQDIRDVPLSVATLSDEKLDVMTSGGPDIRILSSRVPSLHVESSYGRTLPRFYIRGLGNTDFDLNASQPVSLVYDEVVLENPILKGFPIFDLERVEVLRGPQGTLFGRNTPAGIVKFESRKPSHEKSGYGRVSYGTYETAQVEAAAGGSIVEDILAGRVSFLYQGRGDWVNNEFARSDSYEGFDELGSHDDFAGRVQFLLTPNPEFSALVNVHVRDLEGTARLFHANIVESGSDEVADDFDRRKMYLDGANFQHLETRGGSAKLEFYLENHTITSVTGYENGEIFSRGDVDGGFGAAFAPPTGPRGDIAFPSETADAIPSLNQYTQEIRISSNDGEKVNYQGGVFYFKEDLEIESHSFDTFAGGAPNGFAVQTQDTKAFGVFGTLEYQVSDEFAASGGLRFSHDEKDFTAERTSSPIGGGALAPITVNPDADLVAWNVDGRYTVNEDVNLYARAASSFRAPSIQGRVLFGDTVSVAKEEKIISIEGGVKANLAENKARASLSLFYYVMNDQQLTAVGGAQNFNTLLNADKSNGMGFEAELEYLPTPELSITAGVSYNKTEIDDPSLGTAPGGAAGLTVLDPELSPGVVSIDGNSLPNAPEWVVNGTVRGSVPAGDEGELFLFTDWAFRSKVNFFLYESVEFVDQSLIEGGLRVGYTNHAQDYEAAFFVRNLTNDLSRDGGIDFNNLTGFVNDPRTIGVELRRGF